MKKLFPNLYNTTTSIFIFSFLTLIIFSCQDVTSNIDPLKQYKNLTSASQLEPDSVTKIDIMKNGYFKLFSDIKDGFYFGSYDKITDFVNLSHLFYSDNKKLKIETKSYYKSETKSNLYALFFNEAKLSKVVDLNDNEVGFSYEYDNSKNIKKVTEIRQYNDLIETDQNKTRILKGGKGTIQTNYDYIDNILNSTSVNYSDGRVKTIRFLNYTSKSDSSIKVIKEIEPDDELSFLTGSPPDHNFYIFKDNKLIAYLRYKGTDSIPFCYFEFTYLAERNIQIDCYQKNASANFIRYEKVLVEIDDSFYIQNISVIKELSPENKFFETQFRYIFEDEHLLNMKVLKRYYSKSEEANLPNFELKEEFTRVD